MQGYRLKLVDGYTIEHWIQVGCEIVDCCDGCPGDIVTIGWRINVDGEIVDKLVLQFAGLTREVAASLRVEGNARWNAEAQQIEVYGPGQVFVRGLVSEGASPRWSPTSPRMTIGGIEAKPGAGVARTLRVKVQQQVGRQALTCGPRNLTRRVKFRVLGAASARQVPPLAR